MACGRFMVFNMDFILDLSRNASSSVVHLSRFRVNSPFVDGHGLFQDAKFEVGLIAVHGPCC